MRPQVSDEVKKLFILIRIDSQRLFERIKYRKKDYMQTYSLRRTRDHFKEIFKNKFKDVSIIELKNCSEEVISALDHFYSIADEMEWYLNHTQDLPKKVNHTADKYIRDLEKSFEILSLFLGADINPEEEKELKEESFPSSEGPMEEPAGFSDF